mgnify:CR=1 FL=1
MTENELAKIVVNTCFEIHKELGPGLLESVYEEVLCYELDRKGLIFKRQHQFPVMWRGVALPKGFRVDVLVEDKFIVEFKSVLEVQKVEYKRLQTYLKLLDKRLGLMINFNEVLIKNGIKRVVNGL